jgi:hypothetical protein
VSPLLRAKAESRNAKRIQGFGQTFDLNAGRAMRSAEYSWGADPFQEVKESNIRISGYFAALETPLASSQKGKSFALCGEKEEEGCGQEWFIYEIQETVLGDAFSGAGSGGKQNRKEAMNRIRQADSSGFFVLHRSAPVPSLFQLSVLINRINLIFGDYRQNSILNLTANSVLEN